MTHRPDGTLMDQFGSRLQRTRAIDGLTSLTPRGSQSTEESKQAQLDRVHPQFLNSCHPCRMRRKLLMSLILTWVEYSRPVGELMAHLAECRMCLPGSRMWGRDKLNRTRGINDMWGRSATAPVGRYVHDLMTEYFVR